MSTKTMQSNLTAKFAAVLAAFAVMFAIAAAPSQAFATNSTSEPDNIVVVNWIASTGDSTHPTYECSAEVDLSALTHNTSTLGGLFEKNGVNVVKTDEYVTIASLLTNATDSYSYKTGEAEDPETGETVDVYTTETYRAIDSFTAGKSLTFDCWNYNKTTKAWTGVSQYTKNSSFTYANMTALLPFYDASPTAINTGATLTSSPAVIALKSLSIYLPDTVTDSLPNGYDASDVLTGTAANVYATVGYVTGALGGDYDTPRLIWGYDSTLTSQMGNRFPSNIDAITIG